MSCSAILALIALVPLVVLANFDDGGINLGHQKGFFEGDILWKPKKNRNGIFKTDRWTDGIVPYFINPDSIRDWFTKEHLQLIDEAMRTIEKHTCVRFVPYTNQTNFVKIHAGSGCFTSGVGMEKGENLVSLSSTACMVHRIIIHELLHRIGLHHEQSRYDRDQYITVHYDRLANNGTDEYSKFQLRIVNETESSFYGIPYNYASVMHYDAWSLGDYTPGYFIMEPKNLHFLSVMGYAQTANETDFEKIRRIYDCKGSYPVVPPANIPCVDEDKWFDCNETYDYCDKTSGVIHNCRKSCGYCVWGNKPVSKQRPCKDWRPDCPHFADKCTTESWLARKCPITCKLCKEGTMEVVPTPGKKPPAPGCEDGIAYCGDYKKDCGKADWMNTVCRNTCGLC